MKIKLLLKIIWNNLIPILIIYFLLDVLISILFAWNNTIYGFSQFGPIIFISLIFPLIWIFIYVLCRKIENNKNKIKREEDL